MPLRALLLPEKFEAGTAVIQNFSTDWQLIRLTNWSSIKAYYPVWLLRRLYMELPLPTPRPHFLVIISYTLFCSENHCARCHVSTVTEEQDGLHYPEQVQLLHVH
jgi:hypothetical protein